MSNKFKCIIKGNKLIIEPRPNGKTTISVIRDLLKNKPSINEIIISEGIEEVGEDYFNNLNNIVKVTLPNSLKKIGKQAFSHCLNLKEITFSNNPSGCIEIDDYAFMCCMSLENLNIENGVTSIGRGAFSNCESLENVYLPDSLVSLGLTSFVNCDNLKTVRLPSNLEKIENSTFCYCSNLETINFPKNLKEIGSYAFKHCSSLKNVSLPSSLLKISENAFESCKELENINFNEGLEIIDDEVFSHCSSLTEATLPTTLKHIGARTFSTCRKLKKVVMNNGVIKMGESVFSFCSNLEEIMLSNNLKEIPSATFNDCFKLKKVVFPNSVQSLCEDIFYRCNELKEVVLSKNIKKISTDVFECCGGLEKIIIPDGIEEIAQNAFADCFNLRDVYLPTTLKKFDRDSFEGCRNLSSLYLKSKGIIIKVDVQLHGEKNCFVRNEDKLLFLYNSRRDICGFYKDGEYVEFDDNALLNNDKIVKLIQDNGYDRGMYIKLYYYSKKRFIPSNIVIENMPLRDIDKFYINNNGQEWAKLVKASVNVTLDENKASFFKLCYVLGVFSESTIVRDTAVKFLNENIVNVLDGYAIHSKFDGFDLSNGFNEEFAEFFIKYYNTKDFMIYTDEDEWGDEEEIDLIAASYNNFKNVKKIYPNKTLHTNREADLLLPEHVMNAVRLVEYDDVDEGNEDFALTVGRYGYTQEQFEKLQEWYNKGKQIKEMKLFINEDKEEKGITYNLLSKQDPLNAVLGNITNCCQVVGGVGQECVEYGMTMPNSGFITFNYKDKIIGQAWVWYDEESNTVCLDNIEVPHRYLEKISQNKTIQKSFIDCLLRIANNFKEEMNKIGLKVDKVTIGEGYNDIKEILDKNFELLKYHNFLGGYGGYTDSSSQYEIKQLEKSNKRK